MGRRKAGWLIPESVSAPLVRISSSSRLPISLATWDVGSPSANYD